MALALKGSIFYAPVRFNYLCLGSRRQVCGYIFSGVLSLSRANCREPESRDREFYDPRPVYTRIPHHNSVLPSSFYPPQQSSENRRDYFFCFVIVSFGSAKYLCKDRAWRQFFSPPPRRYNFKNNR